MCLSLLSKSKQVDKKHQSPIAVQQFNLVYYIIFNFWSQKTLPLSKCTVKTAVEFFYNRTLNCEYLVLLHSQKPSLAGTGNTKYYDFQASKILLNLYPFKYIWRWIDGLKKIERSLQYTWLQVEFFNMWVEKSMTNLWQERRLVLQFSFVADKHHLTGVLQCTVDGKLEKKRSFSTVRAQTKNNKFETWP